MDLGIEGRVALVGGASQGIGRAVAEVLIAEGARVVITAREEARTAAIAGEIGAAAGYGWDSGDLDGATALVARVGEDVGEIDILVTNTGVRRPGRTRSRSPRHSGSRRIARW